MKYENLSVQALKCMYVSTALSSLLALAVLGAVNYFYLIPEDIVPGKLASLILAVLICLNLLFSPWFRYHRYRYSINQECIDIREGYLFTRRDIVPIERLRRRRCHHPLSGRKTGRGDRRQPAPPDQPDCNRTEERLWKHQLDFAIISRSSPNGWSGDWYF